MAVIQTINTDNNAQQAMEHRYRRAQHWVQLAYGGPGRALNTTVVPCWIDQSPCFWYVRERRSEQTLNSNVAAVCTETLCKDYRLVDAEQQSNMAAFDHQVLAQELAERSGQGVDAANLPLTDLAFDLIENTFSFTAFGLPWLFDKNQNTCKQNTAGLESIETVAEIKCSEAHPEIAAGIISPDGKKTAFLRQHNLWLKDLQTGQEHPLTKDGEAYYTYGSGHTLMGAAAGPSPDILWSPNSQRILTHLVDTRHVKIGIPMVRHVPLDGSVRPQVDNPERHAAQATDEVRESWQLCSINVNTRECSLAECPPIVASYPHYLAYYGANRAVWGGDSRHAYCIAQNADGTETRLLKWDTETCAVQALIAEDPDIPACIIPVTHVSTQLTILPETHEILWLSERSGWMHLYLYDGITGDLKTALTGGEWLVRNILHCDVARRELFIQTAGRDKTRNPYYRDICSLNLDSGELTTLCASDHDYIVADRQKSMMFVGLDHSGQSCGVSPCGRYIVSTRSRVDELPVTILIDREGGKAVLNDDQQQENNSESKKRKAPLTVETADISALPSGWQWPESFMLQGDSGNHSNINENGIYAVVFRPPNFSADKSYPVLDMSFTFTEPVGAFTNNVTGDFHYLSSLAYAELGFIVVRVTNRGDLLRRNDAGVRSRAFHRNPPPRTPGHNMGDNVAAIRQLCSTFPYMDINRVGVADYVSSSTALTAMLVHSDLYRVGVSVNPGDPRFHPIDRGGLRGGTAVPALESYAANLRGKLLLCHGMMDSVLPMAATLRVVEALRKANKDFDMLLMPNAGHGPDEYSTRRGWDFLVTHLLGTAAPTEFSLAFEPAQDTDA